MKVFYTLPTCIEASPYLQWDRDPDAERYIQKLIRDQGLPLQAEPIAKILIEKLEIERERERKLSESALALCAQLFLSQQRGGWIETDQLTQLQQPLFTFNPRSISPEDPANRGLRTCSTALLAELLLSGWRGSWIRSDIFEKLQRYDTSMQLKDVYAVGVSILYDPKHFVRKFAPKADVNWYKCLRSWSDTKFRRLVIDGVRKETGLKYFKRTNLGMLKLSSDTRVEQVLIAAGEQGNRLEGLLLIHQCLQKTVKAKTFDTKNPQPAHYANLLIQYNEQQGGQKLPIPDGDNLKEHLTSMGKILRSYEQPQILSLDTPLGNGEAGQITTRGETLTSTGNSLGAESASESTSHGLNSLDAEDCQDLAIDLLQQLTIEQQQLLMFLCGLQLNQSETGLEVGCHQANVHRRRDKLLLGIAKKLYPQLSTLELTAALIDEIISGLKEVYEDYYPELFVEILTDVAASNPLEQVCQVFIDQIQSHWQFEFHAEERGLVKARAFVESRSRLWRSSDSV